MHAEHTPAHEPLDEEVPTLPDRTQHVQYQHISTLRHPAIVQVDSILESCNRHSERDLRLTYQMGVHLSDQEKLESFVREFPLKETEASRRIFLFSEQDPADFRRVVDDALLEHGFDKGGVAVSMGDCLERIAAEFISARGLTKGSFQAEMGILALGPKPRWHLDSYDMTGEKLQLILVCAGAGGTLVTTGDEYDAQDFQKSRDLLGKVAEETERKRQSFVAEHGERAYQAQKLSDMQAQQFIVGSVERSLRELVPEGQGVTTDPQTLLIFKAGEGLHANGPAEGNRLVFSIGER